MYVLCACEKAKKKQHEVCVGCHEMMWVLVLKGDIEEVSDWGAKKLVVKGDKEEEGGGSRERQQLAIIGRA